MTRLEGVLSELNHFFEPYQDGKEKNQKRLLVLCTANVF